MKKPNNFYFPNKVVLQLRYSKVSGEEKKLYRRKLFCNKKKWKMNCKNNWNKSKEPSNKENKKSRRNRKKLRKKYNNLIEISKRKKKPNKYWKKKDSKKKKKKSRNKPQESSNKNINKNSRPKKINYSVNN